MPQPKIQFAPTERLAVLVAEDNPVMQTVIKFMLSSWGYQPVLTADGQQAWDILQDEPAPQLVLLDWMMPGIDGVELCRRIRATRREPYTYVLLLSARTDSADLVRAMDAGADDYLRKPFDAQELRVRLNAGSRIVLLQQQLLAAREALRDQAAKDSLTGLWNHATILDLLSREIERSSRAGQPIAAALLDIDRFRQINDSFGHLAGDEVLRELARRLRAAAPPEASIGRYGGEEFLVVLPAHGCAAARTAVKRLRDHVSATPFAAGAAAFPVSCSAGVACSEVFGSDATALLRQADESLFWETREARKRTAAAPLNLNAELCTRAAGRS